MKKWNFDRKIQIILIIIIFLELLFILNFRIVFGSGQSMLPTINEFEVLICKYQDDFEVGDIVYYEIDNLNVVHRIVNVENIEGFKFYTLQGDNNEYEDMFKVTNTNIQCKVLWH